MPNLQNISITFYTHNDNRDSDTVLHVFVKNRSNTSSTPERHTTFIGNLLAYQRYAALGSFDINPYLGFAQSLAQGSEFEDPSNHTFDIPLRSQPIPLEEIVLPVVNIHILPSGNDRWIFSYMIRFIFDDGRSFSASSDTNGVTGIILDQNNRDYSGICVENPFKAPPPLNKPVIDAVLTEVTLEFGTHNDDKDSDTQLNVHIVNRLNASSSQDIAVGVNLLKDQSFGDKSYNKLVFSKTASPLASDAILLRDIVLPVVNINIGPNGDDRWTFDYKVTYTFSNGQSFASSTSGITLDQDNHKYTGVYEGDPFPTVTPPSRPQLSSLTINNVSPNPKRISLSFFQQKLDQFINNRQGIGSQYPPLTKLRLHNSGVFGSTLPESYFDLQSIAADPPPPGTIIPPSFKQGVRWGSSPSSLGQLTGIVGIGDLYLNDIKSKSITAKIDPSKPTPIVIDVDFETEGPPETVGGFGGMDFIRFRLRLSLTLTVDHEHGKLDVMSWASDLDRKNIQVHPVLDSFPLRGRLTGRFLGQPFDRLWLLPFDPSSAFSDLIDQVIHVDVVTTEAHDPGGHFQKKFRENLYDTLTRPEVISGLSARDRINAMVNSWLLGGVIEKDNGCKVLDAQFDGDELVISYTRPPKTFVPPAPQGWPAGYNFSPGTLANIDHIVVLTMENRSFDHMLGYLSLPPAKGGMGRTDVDGLKGNEFNMLGGVICPSFPLQPGDTTFAPDPPHDPEPVARAINGGKMDGFARSYAEEHGPAVAPRIMGYHTAANVPVYDALARDFAISHRWFASHPGPTFCNRFYELTGRLNLDPEGFWENTNSGTLIPVFIRTIFDELTDHGVSWKYFEHYYCFLRFFEGHTFDHTNITSFDDPINGFLNLAKTGKLPSVSFIDPHFIELPPDGNCDGPPADIKEGQALVKKVVEAVVSSPKWTKTLLLITYDEHGGFFDHVPPPPAVKVSPDSSIKTFGVRVPTFVISPWIKAGTVFGRDGVVTGGGGGDTGSTGNHAPVLPSSLYFDHTSILKTIARRFMSSNPPYMGARFAAASDLSAVVGSELRTSQFLPFIPYNLVYGASQKRLDVQGGSSAPGTILWQFDPNTTPAQEFSFEDAGSGFVYIRTHTGRLYVTVDVKTPAIPNQPLGIKEDVKYPANTVSNTQNPDYQRWKLGASGISIPNANNFTISNAAFPGQVLQPSGGSLNSGTPVILGAPTSGAGGANVLKNAWHVTSPLLPGDQIVTHP